MPSITVKSNEISQPIQIERGAIVTVIPSSGATAKVEYTTAKFSAVRNGDAVWANWPKGNATAKTADLLNESGFIRITASGGSVDLDIDQFPSDDGRSAFINDWDSVPSGVGVGGSGGGNSDISYATAIPLASGGNAYMPQQTVSGPISFTVGASPAKGSLVYLRLVSDGANAPSFSGMKEWGGSIGYDNRPGVVNQIQFFHDGYDTFYSISQEVGAQPQTNATAVTLSGPSSGVVSVQSSNFTVGVSPNGGTITGTLVVTPSDGGAGGTFAPASISLTTASPTGTFKYTPASTGAKTISVSNNGGLSNPSNITYTVSAAATSPGAPNIGTATAGDASASVAFTAPASDGGSAITGYTVTSSPGGLTGTGTASPITVNGLTNGTAYTFTVTATNAVGTGPASAASNSVTPQVAVAYPRMTVLQAVTESGSGPYTYAGTGAAFGAGTTGDAVFQKVFQANTDGEVIFKSLTTPVQGTGPEIMVAVDSANTAQTYAQMDYGVVNHPAGYQPFIAGSGGTATNTVAGAANDYIRIKRTNSSASPTLTIDVSKDSGSTWTNVYTKTAAPAGVLYPHVATSAAASFQVISSSGLA